MKNRDAHDFEGPVTWVQFTIESLYSLIDIKGRVPTKRNLVRFDKFKPGVNVCAIYDKNGIFAFINTRGKMVVPFGRYVRKRYFHEGYYGVQNARGVWCFLDKNGKLAIPCKFRLKTDFSEGLFIAGKNGGVGFVNTKGKDVIPYRYRYANNFREGAENFPTPQFRREALSVSSYQGQNGDKAKIQECSFPDII